MARHVLLKGKITISTVAIPSLAENTRRSVEM